MLTPTVVSVAVEDTPASVAVRVPPMAGDWRPTLPFTANRVFPPPTVQAPPVVALPQPELTVRVNESVASVVGGGMAVTVTWRVVLAVAPSSSVTVRVIV